MKRLVSGLVFLTLGMGTALAEEASGPSFDCAKARTAVEKAICDAPLLGWYDRQLGRSWKIALKAAGDKGAPALRASQTAFLKARNACGGGDDSYDCIAEAYSKRLAALAKGVGDAEFGFAVYADETGSVDVMRYPGGTAALNILTIGANDHTCGFETDDAVVDGSGVIHWSEKPDPMYEEACTITGSPSRNALTIDAEGDGCQYYCGMRAQLSGTFPVKHH